MVLTLGFQQINGLAGVKLIGSTWAFCSENAHKVILSATCLMSADSPARSLSREELHVIQHVRSWMASKPNPSVALLSSVFDKGAISIYHRLVKVQQIPTGYGWNWNQNRKKKEHILGTEETMVMTKLIPRRSVRNKDPRPLYKLWHVVFTNAGTVSTVLYCEKGVDKSPTCHICPLYGSNIALVSQNTESEDLCVVPNRMSVKFLCS